MVGPHYSPETGERVVVRVLEAPEGGGGDVGDPASILRLGGRGENLSPVELFNFDIDMGQLKYYVIHFKDIFDILCTKRSLLMGSFIYLHLRGKSYKRKS